MLNNKGIAITTVAGFMSGILGLSLVMAAAGGPLANTIHEGIEKITNSTGSTLEINGDNELEAKQMMSNASRFVYDRARNKGCAKLKNGGKVAEQNDGKGYGPPGYPALQDTYITRYPDCAGGDASLARGWDAATDAGQDQEGLVSRLSFTVQQEFTLDTTKDQVWLEKNLAAVRDGNLVEYTKKQDNICSYKSPKDNFVAFLSTEDNRFRANKFLSQHIENANSNINRYDKTWFCRTPTKWFKNGPTNQPPLYNGDLKLQFCKGDEGYIQMNKGTPQNTGEAGEDIKGADKRFPYIVLTNKGEDCGRLGGVPKGNNVAGNIFYVELDAGKSKNDHYPWFRSSGDTKVNLFDRESGTSNSVNLKASSQYNIYPPQNNDQCEIAVYDNDIGGSTNGERGYAMFSTGTKINKSTSMPDYTSAEDYDFNPTSADMSKDPRNAEDVYNMLANKGFNGNQIQGNGNHLSPYLEGVKNGREQHFRLHGDLLCVQKSYTDKNYAQWLMCDYNLPSGKRDVTSSPNGDDYSCNPKTGEWAKQ